MPLMRSGFPFFCNVVVNFFSLLFLLLLPLALSFCRGLPAGDDGNNEKEKNKCLILWIPWIWIFACAVDVRFRWLNACEMGLWWWSVCFSPKFCQWSLEIAFADCMCICFFRSFRSKTHVFKPFGFIPSHFSVLSVYKDKMLGFVRLFFFFLSLSTSSLSSCSVKDTTKMIRKRSGKTEIFANETRKKWKTNTSTLWFVCFFSLSIRIRIHLEIRAA